MIFSGTIKRIFSKPVRDRWHCSRCCHQLRGPFGFKGVIAVLFLLTSLQGCISDIDIKPTDTDPVYVVEGWIEQGNFPRVMVSRSQPNRSATSLADLFDLLVNDAQVTVVSGSDREILSLVKDTMYAVLPIYRGYHIQGEVGRAYTVEVKIGDQVFTSTDTLLPPVKLDSVWFSTEPQFENLGLIHINLTDPPEPGNFYRIQYKRIGLDLDYQSILGNILDDRLFNGRKVEFFVIRSGFGILKPEDAYFRKGETVVIKTCRITPRYFKFLTSVISEAGVTLSPLNIQTRAISLMDGGALGGWGCYGISLDTVLIR